MKMVMLLTMIHTPQNTMVEYTRNGHLDAWKPEFKVIKSEHTYAYRVYFVILWLLKGSGTCHPRIYHFGILIYFELKGLEKKQ